MSMFDPNTPAGKLAEELQREHYSKQSPTINIVNNTITNDLGDNSIVQIGNNNTATSHSGPPAKKWYASIVVWAGSVIASIVLLAVKHYMQW